MHNLRFDGSAWINLDIARRNIDSFYQLNNEADKFTPIEVMILRALAKKDGQHASQVADEVGRAATSFTPNLDKLEQRGYIFRQADSTDRRSVGIFLTDQGKNIISRVVDAAIKVDESIENQVPPEDWDTFCRVLETLQRLETI